MNQVRNHDGLSEAEFLAAYTPGDYEKPSMTTDILLFTVDEQADPNPKKSSNMVLKLLLIKRKDHPFLGQWALPGGFVDMQEGITAGAYRELLEETNIVDDVYLEQLCTVGDNVHRDPRMRVISTAYMALTPNTNIKNTKAGDDASEAAWFTVSVNTISKHDSGLASTRVLSLYNEERDENIQYIFSQSKQLASNQKTFDTHTVWTPGSAQRLAFDHIEIVELALQRLKNKVEYTPIAFTLLPETFTLNEVQKLYEVLLGRTLTKQNFRKKMLPMLNKCEQQTSAVHHRPSHYYRYNPYWELELGCDD